MDRRQWIVHRAREPGCRIGRRQGIDGDTRSYGVDDHMEDARSHRDIPCGVRGGRGERIGSVRQCRSGIRPIPRPVCCRRADGNAVDRHGNDAVRFRGTGEDQAVIVCDPVARRTRVFGKGRDLRHTGAVVSTVIISAADAEEALPAASVAVAVNA